MGQPSRSDAEEIFKLHQVHQKKTVMSEIIHHPKTMFLYACNVDKERKNIEMLVAKSKQTGNPVARLKAQWGLTNNKEEDCLQQTKVTFTT